MTATASDKKYFPALHNWKCGIQSQKKFGIIILILHMLAVPAVIISAIISICTGHQIDNAEPYAAIAIFTTAAAGFLGIFTAVESFKCLYSRSVVDMKLSLPMTSDQRFISNYLTGLFTYIAPFLAAQIIGIILICCGLVFIDGKTFEYVFYSYPEPTRITYVCDFFHQAVPYYFRLLLCGILTMVMLYTLTVLVTVCCGSKFECIAYSLIINGVIPLTIIAAFYSLYASQFGLDANIPMVNVISCVCPVGGIYRAALEMDDYDINYSLGYLKTWVWAVIFLLVTIAFGALAFFLYRRRRAEQVSKPFVFKLVYYIMITGIIFCVFVLLEYEGSLIIPTMIVTAVIYMIFEVVANRGFKKFWLSGIKYIATVAFSFALVFAADKTEGFGAVYKVPSEKSVSSVTIDYNGFFGDFNFLDQVTLSEQQNIEAVINAHNIVLGEHKEKHNDIAADISYAFKIDYKLKNGLHIRRYYNIVTPSAYAELSCIDLSDEFKDQAAEEAKEMFDTVKDEIRAYLETNNKNTYDRNYDDDREKITLSLNNISVPEQSASSYYLYNHDFFENVRDAYIKDIMAINEDNYYHSELTEIYILSMGYTRINFPASFENTLSALADYDLKAVHLADFSDGELMRNFTSGHISSPMICSADEWRDLLGITDDSVLYPQYSRALHLVDSNEKNIYLDTIMDHDYFDIIRHAQPRNIVAENGYVIEVQGKRYTIPPEYYDTAKRLMTQRTKYSEYYTEDQYAG